MKNMSASVRGDTGDGMTAKRRMAAYACAALIAVTLWFIWGRSSDSAGDSTVQSNAVMGFLTPLLELFVGKGNVTDHLVRKLAHFAEFGALGGETALFAAVRGRKGIQPVINCLSAGLFTAVIDESIQYLAPGRSPQVDDILLDFSGVLTGVAAMLILCAVVSASAKRRGEKRREKKEDMA